MRELPTREPYQGPGQGMIRVIGVEGAKADINRFVKSMLCVYNGTSAFWDVLSSFAMSCQPLSPNNLSFIILHDVIA